jgi:hypothetical protein
VKKFNTGVVVGTALAIALIALGVGFSVPTGEQSKLVYEGDLWCVSNFIAQEPAVADESGMFVTDDKLKEKQDWIVREQVKAESKEEAEETARKNGGGRFEPSDKTRLRQALDANDKDFFVAHFNTGATSPGPCLGSGNGSITVGRWLNNAIGEDCFGKSERVPVSTATSNPKISEDKKNETLKNIDATKFKANVSDQRKSEIIAQIKKVYLDVIERYPELTSHESVKYTSLKFEIEDYGNVSGIGMIGGECQPNIKEYQRKGTAYIILGVDQFGNGMNPTNLTKSTIFHEFLHCTSGLIDNINEYNEVNGGIDSKYGNLEESSIWAITYGYAPFGDDAEAISFYEKMANIFIKRGDSGDKWRVLINARLDGPEAFNKRLSFLKVPSGYLSPLGYLESLLEDKNDETRILFGKASTWISSKNPPLADYKTYSFDGGPSAGAAREEAKQVQEPTLKPDNCPADAPEPGPSSGKDIMPSVKIK